MTDQPFNGFEEETQTKTHYEGTVVDPQQDLQAQIVAADSMHSAITDLARQNSALAFELEKYKASERAAQTANVSAPLGGPPVAHHLHLVDGRIIANHDGIGTHYSEVIPVPPGPNGEYREPITRITRIVQYYPANEVDPTAKYA